MAHLKSPAMGEMPLCMYVFNTSLGTKQDARLKNQGTHHQLLGQNSTNSIQQMLNKNAKYHTRPGSYTMLMNAMLLINQKVNSGFWEWETTNTSSIKTLEN